MPIRSESQRKKLLMLEAQGKLAKGTVARWEAETPDKKLPERVKPKRPKTIREMQKKGK